MRLRRLTRNDEASLFALDSDPAVMRWINGGQATSLEAFRRETLPVYLSAAPEPFGFWIIELQADAAGWVSLRPELKGSSARLGYRLARPFWGRGIATRAASEMVRLGFEHSPIDRIVATTYEENLASQRVLEKVGFRLERRFRMTSDKLAAEDTAVSSGELWPGDDLLYLIERGKTAATSLQ